MNIYRQHRKLIIAIIIATIVILYFSFSDKEKRIPTTLHTVDTGTVEFTVSNTRAGTIKACRRAKLSPAMGGQVARLVVKEGDKVSENQLLMEIWNEDLKSQVQLAKSEALASKQTAEEFCLIADAAKRDEQRIMTLWNSKLASEEKADQAQTNTKTREAACKAARSRADVSLARLSVAEASLERTRLRAPFPGFVAEINGEIGEYATPSPPGIPTPPAIDIVDTSCLYILAPIDEVDAPNIVEGMEARITLDAYPKKNFLGAVRRIAPYVFEVEKQARTVDIEAIFMDETEYKELIPGYSANVEVIIDAKYDVVRIPTEAIVNSNQIYILDSSDDSIHLKTIETGISNWSFTEVIKGVKLKDKIVLSIDREGIADGVLIKPEVSSDD